MFKSAMLWYSTGVPECKCVTTQSGLPILVLCAEVDTYIFVILNTAALNKTFSYDCAHVVINANESQENETVTHDDVANYFLEGRYVVAPEGMWKLLKKEKCMVDLILLFCFQ
jgi:hypothetical protein